MKIIKSKLIIIDQEIQKSFPGKKLDIYSAYDLAEKNSNLRILIDEYRKQISAARRANK